MSKNIILEKTKFFWIKISRFYLKLKNKKYFEISSQFFSSWTLVWANFSEAQWDQSNSDFIHKVINCFKRSLWGSILDWDSWGVILRKLCWDGLIEIWFKWDSFNTNKDNKNFKT